MNIEMIVSELKDQRARVDRAITALSADGVVVTKFVDAPATRARRKHRISAASRKAMSQRMKDLWSKKRNLMLSRRGLRK